MVKARKLWSVKEDNILCREVSKQGTVLITASHISQPYDKPPVAKAKS